MFKRSLSRNVLVVIALVSIATAGNAFAFDVPGAASVPGGYSSWQVVGPAGGDVRVVTIDPKDKDRLFASTLDGQVHQSDDAGRSWRLLVNLNKPELILDQLIVDSRDSRRIYTSGHRHKAPGGFFKTTDGGATWTESKQLRNESIHAMTQASADPNMLIVGTTTGIWVSNDSGGDWKKVSSSTMPININSLAVDPRTTDTIYAGTWWRPYKSTDAGKNWRLIKNGMIDDSDVFAITINPRNAEHIIASACSGIYETFTGGEKWNKIQGIPSQSRRTRAIVQHPTQPATLYAGTTEGFWLSANAGKSWALTTQRNLEVNSIAVHPDEPTRVYIGTNNYGVMVSNDSGRTFTQTNQGYTSRFTYFVQPDTHQQGRLYAATHNTATGGGFFFVSNDNGQTWQPARNLDVNRVRAFSMQQHPVDPNIVFLGTNVGLFRSTDRGNSFAQVAAPPAPKAPVKAPARRTPAKAPVRRTAAAVAAVPKPAATTAAPVAAGPKLQPLTGTVKVLEYVPDGSGVMLAGTDQGVFRSADPAKGWEKLPFGGGTNENIYALHIAAGRPDTIWAGTSTAGVIVSRDGGKTWAKAGGAVDGVPISSIATDPRRPEYVYVGTTQTFYVSRDNGATWNRRGGNLPLGNFTSILINPNKTDEIILGSSLDTDGGIFISEDAGNRWKRVDGKDMNLASRRFWTISFDPQNPDRIFAGTHSSGVYLIERSSTAAVEGDRPRVVPDGN
jgi:photosystem II stability/assembly factor-like uncharacterized protein